MSLPYIVKYALLRIVVVPYLWIRAWNPSLHTPTFYSLLKRLRHIFCKQTETGN